MEVTFGWVSSTHIYNYCRLKYITHYAAWLCDFKPSSCMIYW